MISHIQPTTPQSREASLAARITHQLETAVEMHTETHHYETETKLPLVAAWLRVQNTTVDNYMCTLHFAAGKECGEVDSQGWPRWGLQPPWPVSVREWQDGELAEVYTIAVGLKQRHEEDTNMAWGSPTLPLAFFPYRIQTV